MVEKCNSFKPPPNNAFNACTIPVIPKEKLRAAVKPKVIKLVEPEPPNISA